MTTGTHTGADQIKAAVGAVAIGMSTCVALAGCTGPEPSGSGVAKDPTL